jgi:hypothetical protein
MASTPVDSSRYSLPQGFAGAPRAPGPTASVSLSSTTIGSAAVTRPTNSDTFTRACKEERSGWVGGCVCGGEEH